MTLPIAEIAAPSTAEGGVIAPTELATSSASNAEALGLLDLVRALAEWNAGQDARPASSDRMSEPSDGDASSASVGGLAKG